MLEAGLGEGPEAWAAVTALLVPNALVLRPRRWGLRGEKWEPGFDRRAAATAERLHVALAEMTSTGFVLVAHSLGALTARALVRQHPESVRGLVLVDPTVEEQPLGVLPFLRAAGLAQAGLAALRRDARRRAVVAEQRAFPASVRQVARLEGGRPAGVPTVILTAGADKGWERTAAAHERLARRLDARHVVVADAGHHIQRDQPATVAGVISELRESPVGWQGRPAGGGDPR